MKRIVTVTLIITLLSVCLVACNNTKPQEKANETEGKPTISTSVQETSKVDETTIATANNEPTTKKEKHYISEQSVNFSYAYISPQTCEKIISLYDGITLKKGDKIDIADVGFSEADSPKALGNFISNIAYGIGSPMSSDSTVLTVYSKSVNIKISYDTEKLTLIFDSVPDR